MSEQLRKERECKVHGRTTFARYGNGKHPVYGTPKYRWTCLRCNAERSRQRREEEAAS